MGANGSRSLASKSLRQENTFEPNKDCETKQDDTIDCKTDSETKQTTIQTVQLDLAKCFFHENESSITSFLKGFFLNEDLQCAYIRSRPTSYWNIYKITEETNNKVEYRIFYKLFYGKEPAWGIVKSNIQEHLEQLGISRSLMEIEWTEDLLFSYNELFKRQLATFFQNSDYKQLTLKKENTTDISQLKKILTDILLTGNWEENTGNW